MAQKSRHILLTGPPGVGKTTLIRRVYEQLQKSSNGQLTIGGFYTSEVRCPKTKTRTGFELITIPEHKKASLATVNPAVGVGGGRTASLGQYVVTIDDFEPLICDCLKNAVERSCKLVVVDEIGKMECFSELFRRQIVELFDQHAKNGDFRVLATVPCDKRTGDVARNLPLVKTIADRPDVKIVFVTKENRDKLVDELSLTLDELRNS